MANPIVTAVMELGSRRSAADVLGEEAAAPRNAMQELQNLLSELVSGTYHGKISVMVESGTNLTKATRTGTFTAAGEAGMTVTIGGVVLTEGAEWSAGASATASATALAAAINAHASLKGILGATSAAGVVTVTYDTPGRAGNLITLAETSAANFTWAGTALTGATATMQTDVTTYDYGGTG